MLRTAFGAALLAVAHAFTDLTPAVQRFQAIKQSEALTLDVVMPHEKLTSMVFVQTDSDNDFIMDESQSYGNPDPPKLGQTVLFNLGGVWTNDEKIDHINFTCKIFGAVAYNQDYKDVESVENGQGWTYSLPFAVPAVAPSTTYYVTVSGRTATNTELFSIDTNFKF